MRINLTQHQSTPDQECIEPQDKATVQRLLTFDTLPTTAEIENRAGELAKIAANSGAHEAMIGGAPYLMPALERALMRAGVQPLYAFSVRESADQVQPDGSIRKVQVFRHAGWVIPSVVVSQP